MTESGVRRERTGWRDQIISERHRLWGLGLPAIDIDFLLIEYTSCRPAALVEYKHERAAPQNYSHPSYKAIIELGNRARIPVFVVWYADDFSWWTVEALNRHALKWAPRVLKRITEKEYVTLLYRIRGRVPPESVMSILLGD